MIYSFVWLLFHIPKHSSFLSYKRLLSSHFSCVTLYYCRLVLFLRYSMVNSMECTIHVLKGSYIGMRNFSCFAKLWHLASSCDCSLRCIIKLLCLSHSSCITLLCSNYLVIIIRDISPPRNCFLSARSTLSKSFAKKAKTERTTKKHTLNLNNRIVSNGQFQDKTSQKHKMADFESNSFNKRAYKKQNNSLKKRQYHASIHLRMCWRFMYFCTIHPVFVCAMLW